MKSKTVKGDLSVANVPACGRWAVWRGKHPHQPLPAMSRRPRKYDCRAKLRRWGLFSKVRALRVYMLKDLFNV